MLDYPDGHQSQYVRETLAQAQLRSDLMKDAKLNAFHELATAKHKKIANNS